MYVNVCMCTVILLLLLIRRFIPTARWRCNPTVPAISESAAAASSISSTSSSTSSIISSIISSCCWCCCCVHTYPEAFRPKTPQPLWPSGYMAMPDLGTLPSVGSTLQLVGLEQGPLQWDPVSGACRCPVRFYLQHTLPDSRQFVWVTRVVRVHEMMPQMQQLTWEPPVPQTPPATSWTTEGPEWI